MDLTYKVRGADGKEYGPATQEQILSWLREGRIHAQTELTRSDLTYWSTARDFDEFNTALPKVAASSPAQSTSATRSVANTDAATAAQLKSGAGWFYWIAGLSIINSVVALTGSGWGFILGLGVTQILDAAGQQSGGVGTAITLVLNLLVAGVFIAFGVFANKGHLWAFIVGMVLYALDGLIFLLRPDWLGLGFHAFALFCLFRGLTACRALKSA